MYLILDYYFYGLFYDFLRGYCFNKKIMFKFVLLVLVGLIYFYIEIQGIKGKFLIVYRDIKSKNILVKENLICCIVDFGFVVKYLIDIEEIDIKLDIRVGIRRYMVLEVLENNLDFRNFVVFKMVDIYFFVFVLWEIVRRCIFDGKCVCQFI